MQKIAVGILAYAIVLSAFVTIKVNWLTVETRDSFLSADSSDMSARSPDYSKSPSDTRFVSTSVCNPRIAACN